MYLKKKKRKETILYFGQNHIHIYKITLHYTENNLFSFRKRNYLQ